MILQPRFKTKRTMLICLTCLFLLSNAFGYTKAQAAETTNVQELVSSHTTADILAKWKQYQPMSTASNYMDGDYIYDNKPSFSPGSYQAGKLKEIYVEDAIRATNFVRYLAGLPDDVTADWSLSDQEQMASILNALNGGLSHYPPQPAQMSDSLYKLGYKGASSSNLSAGRPTLYSTILFGYMSDRSASNIDRVGHRRWILNPPMKKTMFGMALFTESRYGSYSAMYAFNKDRNPNDVQYDYVSWPSAGYFPNEVFAVDDPWSIGLQPNRYDANRTSDIQVTLKRERDGRVWNLDKSSTDKEGDYFNVDTGGYGIPLTIIFRPKGIESFASNDAFQVTVTGVYTKDGQPTTISYKTTFFDMVPAISTVTQLIKLNVGESFTIPIQFEHSKDEKQQLTYTSTNPNILSIDQQGVVTALREGEGTIQISGFFDSYADVRFSVSTSNGTDRPSAWALEDYTFAKSKGLVSLEYDERYQSAMDRYGFAQAAVGLIEQLQGTPIPTKESPFTDTKSEVAIKAYYSGIMKGNALSQFTPTMSITRQEAAVLLMNIYNKLNKSEASVISGLAKTLFKDDAAIASWAKASVYHAAQLGLLKGNDEGTFLPKGQLTREQTFAMLAKLYKIISE